MSFSGIGSIMGKSPRPKPGSSKCDIAEWSKAMSVSNRYPDGNECVTPLLEGEEEDPIEPVGENGAKWFMGRAVGTWSGVCGRGRFGIELV